MIDKKEAKKHGVNIIESTQDSNSLFTMLKTNFPESIKDNKPDLKAIIALLGLNGSTKDIQGYELTFTGKDLANALYSAPCEKLLKFESHVGPFDETINSKNMQNFIIKGDNLDALKLLKSAYYEKIKMIYIDPPYNTKNENFIYPDNFRKDYNALLEEVGLLEYDENGKEIESESLKFFRNIQGSHSHSGWLAFMLPRLKLARDLLREDGVIFISIDDNEQANLKILCDEIFGEENFVSCLIWNSVSSVLKQSKHFRKEHEYVLCYAKDKDNLSFSKLENSMKFENPDNDPKGEWFSSNAAAANQNKDDNKFSIQLPNGDECIRNWKFSYDDFVNHKVSLYFKGSNVPRLKIYKSDYNILSKIQASILSDLGSLTSAKTEIESFLKSKDLFDTPKPTKLIKHLLKITTTAPEACGVTYAPDSSAEAESASKGYSSILDEQYGAQEKGQGSYLEGDSRNTFSPLSYSPSKGEYQEPEIILDFFAGSGTTAQAVMELNAEDNGNRQCILVQIEEPISEVKNKIAYDFCKNELKSPKPVISDITIERVKRAAKKIAQANASENNVNMSKNLSFSVLSMSEKPKLISNEYGILKLVSNENLIPFDKAVYLALQSGKTLDKKIESIFENKLYKCEECFYLIECDKEVLELLAKSQNENIYIDGFSNMDLESFLNLLNLNTSATERIHIVY